ncbi:MAG: MFS transporter, partial [Stellaceae bacterium]
ATVKMAFNCIVLRGTTALLPTMMQDMMNYPVVTSGLVMVPRGVATMVANVILARQINRIDVRLILLAGFLMTALSLWQMAGFSLGMGMEPVIVSGFLQGLGLGCTFVPLNTVALSNLPLHILTQGTALRSLMRNLGGSIGISVLEALLASNTQIVHSRLVEGLRPDNPLARPPFMPAPYSLSSPGGIAALNAEVTRQAAMVAYVNDFLLMMIVSLGLIVLLLLIRPAAAKPRPALASPALSPRRAG